MKVAVAGAGKVGKSIARELVTIGHDVMLIDKDAGLIERSRGLVIATHNTALMKSLCTHGLVLDKGRVAFVGDIGEALAFYAR